MKILQQIKDATKKQVKATTEEKEFNIAAAVMKSSIGIVLCTLSIMQASAFFKDTGLEALEGVYKGSTLHYGKLVGIADNARNLADSATQAANEYHDVRCSAYKSLKAYKETKGYAIVDVNTNPCTEPLPFQQEETNKPAIQ